MKLTRNKLSLLALLLCAASIAAKACTKEAFSQTTLEKYEKSKFVVIARGIAAEKVQEGDKSYSLFGVKALRMSVEKVFKGDLRIGDEIVLVEGSGSDDVDSFRASDVDRKYLLFLCSRKREPNVFQVLRGMNDWLADERPSDLRYQENRAAGDLLYLEKINEVRGRTRLYGRIGINQDNYAERAKPTVKLFENVRVRINGNGKTHEATTNEDGIFEFYDLPAGEYTISPEIPRGWQLGRVTSFGTSGNDNLEIGSRIKLESGRHAFYDYDLDASNTVSGIVTDPAGKPMHNVCVQLLAIDGKSSDSFLANDCTNRDGFFEFEQVYGGEYLIVVNKDGLVSSDEPFPIAFYPNVFEREKAKIITVVEGEDQRDIRIQIPEVRETVTIIGSFRSADGVPVVGANILFIPDKPDSKIDGRSVGRTDTEGKFSIRILRGLKGKLSGSAIINLGEFRTCPSILKLINNGRDVYQKRESSNIEKITAEKNLDDAELRLTFPSCNGAKIISVMRVD